MDIRHCRDVLRARQDNAYSVIDLLRKREPRYAALREQRCGDHMTPVGITYYLLFTI